MSHLPQTVLTAWDTQRVGVCSLATANVATSGAVPNVIYVGAVCRHGDTFVIANYHFDKTLANLRANPAASLLFITEEKKAYQLKGKVTFHSEGAAFDAVQAFVLGAGRQPCQSAAVLSVEAVYCGAEQLM